MNSAWQIIYKWFSELIKWTVFLPISLNFFLSFKLLFECRMYVCMPWYSLHSCCYVKTMILCNKEETCQAPDTPSSTLSSFQGTLGKFSFEEIGKKSYIRASVSSKETPWLRGAVSTVNWWDQPPTLIRAWWDHCTYLIECSRTLIYVKTEQEQGS